MSVLGSAKVRIDGDAKGAMAALDDAGDAAERLKRRLNDARSSASDMAGGMLRAEAIMGGLRAAVAGAGAATAAYAAENVAVADAFTVVSERGTALAASMAGLALGQGGAEQSSAALVEVMDLLTGVFESNEGAASGLVTGGLAYLIDGLTLAIRFGNGLVDVFELTQLAGDALGTGLGVLTVAASELAGLGFDAASAAAGQTLQTMVGLAEGALNVAEILGGGGSVPESMYDSLRAARQLAAGLQDVESSADRMARVSDAVALGADSMAASVDDFAMRSQARMDAVDSLTASLSDVADGLRAGTLETEQFAGAQERAAGASRGAAAAIVEEAEALKAFEGASVAAFKGQADLAAQKARDDEARALAASDAASRELFEEQQRKAAIGESIALQDQLTAARQKSAEAAIGGVADEVAAVATGQKSLKAAALETVASVLSAKANAYLAEAAALAFVPGGQASAIGLGAAGIAMKVAAAAIGAAGGRGGGGGGQGLTASGAGAAPIASAAPVNRESTLNLTFNAGVVGEPRAAASLIADQVRFAMREGML
jgi:hypothetical protein